jgi:predicted ATP-binding protein involved in virulence
MDNMVNKIKIIKYRKLQDLEFNFSKGINVISGTNGTCKTSLLHIISNSFQKVKKNNSIFIDNSCVDMINNVNDVVNPKIESLTKGDKTYNNPANGVSGALFSVSYIDGVNISFRRHNSQSLEGKSRFSIKPTYKKDDSDKLPEMPVVYLGLSRLFPHGEYQDDENVKDIKKKLPDAYLDIISDIYNRFTGIDISYNGQKKIGDIKIRSEFSSQYSGIDSNTISAGEDNLFIIITALVSLRYYFDNITSTKDIESILLIDEIDATLHPAFQVKLLDILSDFSQKYKIQIVFTTHSLYLLEEALNRKINVIYLRDNIDSVDPMEDIDIYKIRMSLESALKEDIYSSRSIPVFTEDNEARMFLKCLLEYFERNFRDKFSGVKNLFHLVNANISADNLKSIFKDSILLRSTMRSICILDGDQDPDYTNYIITLPGGLNKKPPEELIFEHAQKLYESDIEFWRNKTVLGSGYDKIYYRDNIKPDIEGIYSKIQELKENGVSTKGVKREENKKVFNDHNKFFKLVIINWINSVENSNQVEKFYKDLKVMFKKVSEFHDINSKEWKD